MFEPGPAPTSPKAQPPALDTSFFSRDDALESASFRRGSVEAVPQGAREPESKLGTDEEIATGAASEARPGPASKAPSRDERSFLRRLWDGYFETKSIEKGGLLYRCLGVHLFKAALMGTVGRLHKWMRDSSGEGNNYCLGGHSVEDLKKMEGQTRMNEAIHAGAILVTNLPFIALSLLGGPAAGPIIWGTLALNAYCIMLQRYNRDRLERTIERAESRPSQRIPSFKP